MAGDNNQFGSADTWSSYKTSTSNQKNFLSHVNNMIFITDVQVEEGTVATPFETKPFTTELQLCQRYYLKTPANSASYLPCTNASNHSRLHLMFPVTMRATPSASMSNYTLTATTHGVNGYQSSGSTDTQYEGTFDCSF